MRHLGLITLVWIFGLALNSSVFAQVCCPNGCSPNGYGGCWVNGTTNVCGRISCPPPTPPRGGGGGSGNTSVQTQLPPCTRAFEKQSDIDIATNACLRDLTGNAQFWGCLFEDDAGRAEDQRTGLSCPARQAALAQQCRARCATYVKSLTTCRSITETWQQAFGDIGGTFYGRAHVDLCGPRLRTSIGNLIRPRPKNIPTQRLYP